jgi:hypothetical protein
MTTCGLTFGDVLLSTIYVCRRPTYSRLLAQSTSLALLSAVRHSGVAAVGVAGARMAVDYSRRVGGEARASGLRCAADMMQQPCSDSREELLCDVISMVVKQECKHVC